MNTPTSEPGESVVLPSNVFASASSVNPGARAARSGAVLWFTGLSGAGKSTIAERVSRELAGRGAPVEYLDGDAIRAVFPSTGFSRADRDAHVRRVAFLASRLEHHGIIVVVALISPYRASRSFARRLCARFVEVHVSTPLDVCEARDVKGLYARARAGSIQQFTGIDDPYEAPEQPEVAVDTSMMGMMDGVAAVMCAFDRALQCPGFDGSRDDLLADRLAASAIVDPSRLAPAAAERRVGL